jgi:hypothetical protein
MDEAKIYLELSRDAVEKGKLQDKPLLLASILKLKESIK